MTWTTTTSRSFPVGSVTVQASSYAGYSVRCCYTKVDAHRSTVKYYVMANERTPKELLPAFATEAELIRAIDTHLQSRSVAA